LGSAFDNLNLSFMIIIKVGSLLFFRINQRQSKEIVITITIFSTY